MSKNHRKHLGKRGEDAALTYLESKGFRLVARNYFTPYGEIDLIMMKDHLHFIEVKTRRHHTSFPGKDALTPRKKLSMIRSMQHFLSLLEDSPCSSLDLVEVYVRHSRATILHYPHVLQA